MKLETLVVNALLDYILREIQDCEDVECVKRKIEEIKLMHMDKLEDEIKQEYML